MKLYDIVYFEDGCINLSKTLASSKRKKRTKACKSSDLVQKSANPKKPKKKKPKI